MKVCFVTAFDLSGHSGSNLATRSVVAALGRRTDIQLTLVSPRPADASDLEQELEGVKCDLLPERGGSPLWWHARTALRVFRRVRSRLKHDRPDLVVVRYGPFFALSAFLFPVPRCSLILLIRGGLRLGGPGTFLRRLDGVHRRLSVMAWRRADFLVLAYRGVLRGADHSLPPERLRVVPNAADVRLFPSLSRDRAREILAPRYGHALRGRVLGFAGSMRERHCLRPLLRAWPHLVAHGHARTLLLMGEGPLRDDLEAMARDLGVARTVVFAGRVDHHQIGIHLAACDALFGIVHPKVESNPIKVYEALAAGRPVISSPRPELRFIQEEGFGILVESTEPDVLASAVGKVLDHPWTDADANRARDYVAQHHTWDRVAAQILEMGESRLDP